MHRSSGRKAFEYRSVTDDSDTKSQALPDVSSRCSINRFYRKSSLFRKCFHMVLNLRRRPAFSRPGST